MPRITERQFQLLSSKHQNVKDELAGTKAKLAIALADAPRERHEGFIEGLAAALQTVLTSSQSLSLQRKSLPIQFANLKAGHLESEQALQDIAIALEQKIYFERMEQDGEPVPVEKDS